jgi:hypothetical protein
MNCEATRQAATATITAPVARRGVTTALVAVAARAVAAQAQRSDLSARARPWKNNAAGGRSRGPAQPATRFVIAEDRCLARSSVG